MPGRGPGVSVSALTFAIPSENRSRVSRAPPGFVHLGGAWALVRAREIERVRGAEMVTTETRGERGDETADDVTVEAGAWSGR